MVKSKKKVNDKIQEQEFCPQEEAPITVRITGEAASFIRAVARNNRVSARDLVQDIIVQAIPMIQFHSVEVIPKRPDGKEPSDEVL